MDILNYINKMQEMYGDQASLADDLEPGALKDEMLKDFDPSQETYEEYLQRKSLERPFNMAQGGSAGQLVTPSVDGSRPGYSGLPDGITKTPGGKYKIQSRRSGKFLNVVIEDLDKAKAKLKKFQKDNPIKKRTTQTTTISGDRLKVLNKYAQDAFGLNYKDLGPGQVQEVYNTARNNKFIYKTETIQSPFPKKNKDKLIDFAKEKNIKLNFDEYPKYGVPKDIKGKRNPNYTRLVSFKNRGFKDFKKNLLNKADRIKVMDNFELPKNVKNWSFNTNRFGLPYEGNENLIQRIKNSLKEKKKYKVAADYSTPKGWMVASMNRVYENEIKNGVKPKDLTYQPIKNNKGIIVGFKDNTEAGGGKKYYSIKKYQDEFGDGTAWTAHGDHERVKKFLNIAKGAQVDDPSKLLQKILNDKGITKLLGENRPLRLNDILTHERYFDKLSTTAPRKLIERQVVLHHTKGVNPAFGNAAATKDLQLLSGVINQKVKGLEKFAKERKLTPNEIKQLKNYGAKITDFDGKIVGGGFFDPEKQFKTIEKGAIDYAKSDKFNVKTVTSYLEKLGCGNAAGGRILMSNGGATLTKCARKGTNKLEQILLKGGANKNEQLLANSILRAGAGLKSMLSLRGFLGPAALAFTAAAEAGIVGYDMLSKGKTFKEAVGDSVFNYALGPKLKIDSIEERNKRLRGIGGGPPSQAFRAMSEKEMGKIAAYEAALSDIDRADNLFVKDQMTKQKLEEAKKFFPAVVDKRQKEADAVRADIQDLARTGLEQRLMNVDYDAGAKALKKAQDLITIDQLTSSGPKIVGKILPMTEESRQDAIAKARGMDLALKNANPGVLFARQNRYMYPFGFASGGLANLTNTIPPKSGPMSQGLRSLYNNGKKL